MRKTLTLAGTALSVLQGSLHDPESQTARTAALMALAQTDGDYTTTLTAPLNAGIDNLYAGHRSHSSHSSHSSHYSSSGGGYRSTAPSTYIPPPPPPPATYAPPRPKKTTPKSSSRSSAISTLQPSNTQDYDGMGYDSSSTSTDPVLDGPAPRAGADQLALMVMRVQAALFSKGYDPGAISGEFDASTKAALRKFQAMHGLKASGLMTTETLNALGVALVP
jgi:His-Xaa-Ser repeat protein HxsA